mgnify:FL=1
MDEIEKCVNESSTAIDKYLNSLRELAVSLDEKKGSDSIALRIFLLIVYSIGMILCIIWTFMYKKISLDPVDESLGTFVTIAASGSSAVFFLILIIRKLLDAKGLKLIQKGRNNVSKKIARLNNVRHSSSTFVTLMNGSNKNLDYYIDLGEDLPSFIATTDYEIKKVKIDKANKVDNFLVFTYFVAAVAVGAFIILFMQNGFRNMLSGIITNFGDDFEAAEAWAKGIYIACASISIIGGPIFAWCFFEKIKMIELRERLVFLIAFSTIAAFIAIVIVVAVIAGIVALVCFVVGSILTILATIAIIAIIGAIIFAALGG